MVWLSGGRPRNILTDASSQRVAASVADNPRTNANGNAVSINGDQYRQIIREYLLPEMRNRNEENIFVQQDGATAHTARGSLEMLRDIFPHRFISRLRDVPWPPR